MGAALAAKQATRWLAPALPVFAAKAAPTVVALISEVVFYLRPSLLYFTTALCPRYSMPSGFLIVGFR
ncbi:MAG TPA: hypothetical protein DGQ94_14670 [Pseudomonas sp.]|nr:hypothetical protein [Pseudomonas sp.]